MRHPACVALLLAASLAGCYQPASVAHAHLRVLADGSLVFQGRPVAAAALHDEIVRAMGDGHELVVEVRPDTAAPIAGTQAAVATVKAAHARVAFAHPD